MKKSSFKPISLPFPVHYIAVALYVVGALAMFISVLSTIINFEMPKVIEVVGILSIIIGAIVFWYFGER